MELVGQICAYQPAPLAAFRPPLAHGSLRSPFASRRSLRSRLASLATDHSGRAARSLYALARRSGPAPLVRGRCARRAVLRPAVLATPALARCARAFHSLRVCPRRQHQVRFRLRLPRSRWSLGRRTRNRLECWPLAPGGSPRGAGWAGVRRSRRRAQRPCGRGGSALGGYNVGAINIDSRRIDPRATDVLYRGRDLFALRWTALS